MATAVNARVRYQSCLNTHDIDHSSEQAVLSGQLLQRRQLRPYKDNDKIIMRIKSE